MVITFTDGTITKTATATKDETVTVNLTGLTAGTAYTFKVTADNGATGKDIKFTTSTTPVAGTITTTEVTAITHDSVTLSATVDLGSDATMDITFTEVGNTRNTITKTANAQNLTVT
jgi:hypothetical protein